MFFQWKTLNNEERQRYNLRARRAWCNKHLGPDDIPSWARGGGYFIFAAGYAKIAQSTDPLRTIDEVDLRDQTIQAVGLIDN